jgi:uncharacterized repeat protein (TIGR01451 family)
MKRLPFRRGVVLTLALALVALVAVLWATGLSSQPRQALADAPAACLASLTSPGDGATVTATSPILDWSNGTCTLANLTGHTSDQLKWHVQVDDTSSAFGSVVREKGNISYPTTQWTVSSELAPDNYWWRVRVCHSTVDPSPPDADCSSWSLVREFIVPSGPDLTISKGDTADPVSPGGSFGYNIVVHNGGNDEVVDTVELTDHLPPGFTYVSRTGSDWACTSSTSSSDDFQTGSHKDVTCTTDTDIDDDDDGPSLRLNVTAASTADTYTNWVEVDPNDTITEINEYNNTDSEETTVTAPVDLTVSKGDTADPVSRSGSFGYDIVVSNGGSGTVTATVGATDHLPPGFTYVSYTGTDWTCTSSTSSSDSFQTGSHTDVTCSNGTDIVAGAAGPTLRLNVTGASAADTYTNRVEVDPNDTITETNESNNTASQQTTVTATPTPTPTVTPTPTPTTSAGQLLNCPLSGRWAISVWNGPSGKPIAEALATCTSVTIVAAYSLDPTTNDWLRYFPGRGTDINNLLSLSSMQAIITLGQ